MRNFRDTHLINILETFDTSKLPLDVFLNKYFRLHKALGSKDRAYICEYLYLLIRWKDLIDACYQTTHQWDERLAILKKYPISDLQNSSFLSHHQKVSFPKPFFDILQNSLGLEKAYEFCLNSNQAAPLTIRVNTSKCSRDHLFDLWRESYLVEKCEVSKNGICFKKRINFFELKEFKEGLFEVQDEGSQIVAAHLQAKPGDHVLDYCAGSGGKTLALAPLLEGKGQIYLFDIRPHALNEAKKRLKRAGIQNAQLLDPIKLKKKGLLKRMDWILLDVPCSGSGTLRRNPDMKWRFTPEMVERVIAEQKIIFEKAIKYLADDGKIVYATCSVLPQENIDQVNYFMEKYQLELVGVPFQSYPQPDKMDGFFAAVLKRKEI